MNKNLKIVIIVHILFWLLLILGESITMRIMLGHFNSISHYVAFYVLNIIIFYCFYLQLQCSVGHDGKYGLIILLQLIINIAAYVGISFMLSVFLPSDSVRRIPPTIFDKQFLAPTVWRGLYFMIFATVFFLLKRNAVQKEIAYKKQIVSGQLEQSLLEAEQAYLRAQINPHFLFNTLNLIKNTTRYDAVQARIAIDYMTDILDYAVKSQHVQFIEVREEVVQIENMIALQRMRFGERLKIDFFQDLLVNDIHIIPLVMVSLVENIFKHSNLPDEGTYAVVKLAYMDTRLIFTTENTFDPHSHQPGTKTGLKNISERLKLFYPGNHVFNIYEKSNIFYTELKIYLVTS